MAGRHGSQGIFSRGLPRRQAEIHETALFAISSSRSTLRVLQLRRRHGEVAKDSMIRVIRLH
ncbi:MAG: hypothetical protein DWH91_11555 [Planctomycetota bacterium]|nr:MAG: hypothetical protein DWH91_11555 [Planctomycetota bacterium]